MRVGKQNDLLSEGKDRDREDRRRDRQRERQTAKLSCALSHSFPLRFAVVVVAVFDVMCKSQTTALLFLLFVCHFVVVVVVAAPSKQRGSVATPRQMPAGTSTVNVKLCQLRALHAQ